MSRDDGKFLLGALIGAAAGVVVGILFAPRSGKETREIIGEKAKEYSEKGKELIQKGTKAAKGKIKQTADRISDRMEKQGIL